MFFVSEASGVPATNQSDASGGICPHMVLVTLSLFPLRSLCIVSAAFWCLSSGYYVSVVRRACVCVCLCVCVYTCAQRKCCFHRCCCVSSQSVPLPGDESLRSILPRGACGFPRIQDASLRLPLPLPRHSSPSVLTLSTSVPVLVLVVPAVEIYVERHDASRCHASDKSPRSGAKRGEFRKNLHLIFPSKDKLSRAEERLLLP